MTSISFLQVSDLHLGARFGWLDPEPRAQRRREQTAALERVVREAIERRVDAILVPGDLFDREGVDAETIAFALHAFAVPGCPPVFIAPGNHDPASDRSPCWNARLLRGRGFAWPEHVHVFAMPEWTSRRLADLPVRIWGRCFAGGIESVERPLGPATRPDPASFDPGLIHVAIFHGSREGVCPIGQKVTAPFTDAEALASPFHYLAVGHYHLRSELVDARGVRLAYAGSTVALQRGELGAHGALHVRIERDEETLRIATEPIEIDPRRVHAVDVEVSGATSLEQIDRRIAEALDRAEAQSQDFVTARLVGRLVRGVRGVVAGPELSRRVFQLTIDARAVRPDYDLDAYRRAEPVTTEERFARVLLERLDREPDPDERTRLESALYYGLDAFKLRDVAPAYEEIGE